MEGASLDDVYSDDYTYKDNLRGDPRENLPPSQHDPNSDYQPTPSLDENGTVFCDQYNDHDAVDKGNANAKIVTAQWSGSLMIILFPFTITSAPSSSQTTSRHT
jgi:hypothetical protein